MNGSISVDWVGLVVVLAILALLIQGFRRSPVGWLGMVTRTVLGVLIALIVIMLVWNTLALTMLRTATH